MEVDIPEEGAMGDQVVVVEDLQKRRQDIFGGSDGSNGAGDMPGIGQGSTTRCPFNNKLYAGGGGGGGEYSSGSAPGGGVSVMSEIFREDLLMENPIRAQEEVLFI